MATGASPDAEKNSVTTKVHLTSALESTDEPNATASRIEISPEDAKKILESSCTSAVKAIVDISAHTALCDVKPFVQNASLALKVKVKMEADSKLLSLVKGNPASHLNNNNSNTDNTNATQQIQNGSPICPIKIKEEPVYDQSSSPPPSNTVGNVLTASSSNIHGSNVASLPTEVANGLVPLMSDAPNSIHLTIPTQAANNLNTLISSSPGSIQPTQVGSGFLALISNAPNSVLPTASTPVLNNSPALISSATDGDGQSNGGDVSLPPVRIGTCLLCGNEMCGKGVTCASDDEDDNNDDDDDDAKRDFLPAPPMSSVEVDKLFSNLIEQDKETQMEPTAVINTEMYVHQKQALQWMVNRENSNDLGPFWKETTRGDWFNEGTRRYTDERPKCINGGILADDMGLGKTLTIIALIFTNHINGKPLFLKKETARKRNASVDTAQGPTAPQSKKPCIVISSDESDGKGKKPMKVKKEKDVAAIKKRKEGLMNSKRIKESKKGKDAGEKFRKLFLPTFMKKKNKEGKIVKKEQPTKHSPAKKTAKLDVSSPSTSHGSTVILDDDIDDDLIIEPVTKQPTINTPMKTIDIVSSNPTSQDVAKATLIICPLSVLSNWTDQICTHVNPAVTLRVYLYYGPQRIKDIEYLKKQDIVLTTYPIIANDYSKSIRSPLHKIKWLRIILDEGHTIRNKRTTLAKAALELEGERRWVITGTPIQNRIDDLWVLLLFLRLEPFNDKKWWKTMIANIHVLQKRRLAELADFRLNTLIKHISIRRLKDEKVNNSKLVELPPKHVVIQDIELSEDERKLYDMLQLKGQKTLHRYMEEDSVLRHYGHCFFIIMRLRQMCLYPRLCKETLTELREDLAQAQEADNTQDDDNNADDQDDSNAHLIKVLMEAISAGDSEECAVCLESLTDPVITSCAHVFCSACIKDVINGHAPTCPMCRGPITEAELVRVPEEQLREMNGEIENDDGGGDETHFEGSAKVTALVSSLEALRDKDPSIKSVVISQFTSFLNIVAEHLERHDFQFLRLDGRMNLNERTKALEDFNETGPATVFLLSMSAGGTGISLTAASRVFLMDPAWNPAVEEQCFDRCHRMGQTKEVIITKYIVMDSIEERMLTLQDQKRALMTDAFGAKAQSEEDRRRTRVRDIAHLIGLRPARPAVN